MPNDLDVSMAEFLLPRFWEGRFDFGVSGLLRQLGWPGLTPLLPFLLVWVPASIALTRAVRLDGGGPPPTSIPEDSDSP